MESPEIKVSDTYLQSESAPNVEGLKDKKVSSKYIQNKIYKLTIQILN